MSATDALHVRFAMSPLFELQALVRRLIRGAPLPVWMPPCVDEHRRLLQDLDYRALLSLLSPAAGPAFLAPVPERVGMDVGEELEAITRTDPVLSAQEIAQCVGQRRLTPEIQELLASDDAVRHLTRALGRAWTLMMVASWPKIAAVCERDVVRRSLDLSAGGLAALMQSLAPNVSFVGDTIVVDSQADLEIESTDDGIRLVPSVFLLDGVAVRASRPRSIIYQPTGHGVVDELPSSLDHDLAVGELVGRSRALILRFLSVPGSTENITQTLGYSRATASQHLHVLHRAGLVRKIRSGHRVLYARTVLGDSLLSGGQPPQ